jgi:hypothetical protein
MAKASSLRARHAASIFFTPSTSGTSAGELDHLGPFFGFVGDELTEFRRRAGHDRAAHVGEEFVHLGLDQGGVDLLVQPVDDRGRRSGRDTDAVPDAGLIARHEFSDSRNIRQRVGPRCGGDAEGTQDTLSDVRKRIADGVEHHVHLPADEVVQGGGSAAVGHVHHVNPGQHLEQFSRHVARISRAGRRHIAWKVLSCHNHDRCRANQTNWREINIRFVSKICRDQRP